MRYPNLKEGLILVTLFLCITNVFSQTPAVRRYGTQEYQKNLLAAKPALVDSQKVQELFVSDFIKVGTPEQLTIPIIFHIVKSPNMPIISSAQIATQVDALNRDFNDLDSKVYLMSEYTEPFIDRASIPLIKFCLPQLKTLPLGDLPVFNVTTEKSQWPVGNYVKSEQYGGSNPSSPDKFLNVWICDLVDSISGFSQMPGGPTESDGIVIDYSYFMSVSTQDSSYYEGKTLTHLVGSYLGLNELWNQFYPCFDDGVYDTPVHNEPNTGKNLANRHVSTCLGNDVEMTMNFMDDTDDESVFMFTRGQIIRMQAYLSPGGFRHALVANDFQCIDKITLADRQENPDKPATQPTENELALEISPNPTSADLNLQIQSNENGLLRIRIADISGHIIWQASAPAVNEGVKYTISCKDWPEGVYTILLKSDNRFLFRKAIVQH